MEPSEPMHVHSGACHVKWGVAVWVAVLGELTISDIIIRASSLCGVERIFIVSHVVVWQGIVGLCSWFFLSISF